MKHAMNDVHRDAKEYLKKYPDATPDEILGLYEWMKAGNSPFENGDGVCDDSCHPMDFIATMRFWDKMYQEWQFDPDGFLQRYANPEEAGEPINPKGSTSHNT